MWQIHMVDDMAYDVALERVLSHIAIGMSRSLWNMQHDFVFFFEGIRSGKWFVNRGA